jgi:hypothetical protein
VKTVARKLAWLYGKRGFVVALSVVAAIAGAKCGQGGWGPQNVWGFFDGG